MERHVESWRARLPVELLDMVIAPVHIESFHDDSVPASKWRGYDTSGQLCYYHHTYTLWDECIDAEDETYLRQIEAESLEAWRCPDGMWLRRLLRMGEPGHCNRKERDRGFELVHAREIPRL